MSATTHAGSTAPVSASSPVGKSRERILRAGLSALDRPRRAKTAFSSPSMGRLRPVPNSASTTRWAEVSASSRTRRSAFSEDFWTGISRARTRSSLGSGSGLSPAQVCEDLRSPAVQVPCGHQAIRAVVPRPDQYHHRHSHQVPDMMANPSGKLQTGPLHQRVGRDARPLGALPLSGASGPMSRSSCHTARPATVPITWNDTPGRTVAAPTQTLPTSSLSRLRVRSADRAVSSPTGIMDPMKSVAPASAKART